ncbi:13755_t:CDS:2 [Entrophospora sp. SA101]|nr:13755_t:CDS:2 [Entrophospora sp. SA101]
MSYLLPSLSTKNEINDVIRNTEDLVLALRFGKAEDSICLQLDHIVAKASPELSKLAKIFTIDVDNVPDYVKYFDISLIPATIFFFNAQHIKVCYDTRDKISLYFKGSGCLKKFMKYEIKIYLFKKYLISGIQRAGTPNDLTIRNRLKLNDPLDKQSLSTKEEDFEKQARKKEELLFKDVMLNN